MHAALDPSFHAILDRDGAVVLGTPAFHRWATPPDLDELARAVRAAARGLAQQSSRGYAIELTTLSGRGGGAYLVTIRPKRAVPLSRRQLEVAELAAVGATVREIGEALGISTNTVRQHLKAIYAELGVANRVELARVV